MTHPTKQVGTWPQTIIGYTQHGLAKHELAQSEASGDRIGCRHTHNPVKTGGLKGQRPVTVAAPGSLTHPSKMRKPGNTKQDGGWHHGEASSEAAEVSPQAA